MAPAAAHPEGHPRLEEVETSAGTARIHHFRPDQGLARATLVLGHGAGRSLEGPDLVALGRGLPAAGVEVVLVEQPWLVSGRKVADRAPRMDAAWVQVVRHLRRSGHGMRRLVLGGRSTGARVACRTAEALGPDAVVCLAFPLHPPGRDTSRAAELAAAAAVAPVLVVQGTRDPFGTPEEVAAAAGELGARVATVAVPWADHAFRVPARAPVTAAESAATLVDAVRGVVLPSAGNAAGSGPR